MATNYFIARTQGNAVLSGRTLILKKHRLLKKQLFFRFFLVFILFAPLYAQKNKLEMDDFVIRNWTSESGLPHNTISAITQTKDGYLWLATPSGLARFDGNRFTIFNRQNTPILQNDRVLSLHEDASNKLWIGTDGGGVYVYNQNDSHLFRKIKGLSNGHIQALESDWEGNLWIGTQYGLNRLNGDEIRTFTKQHGLYDNIITALKTDFQGNLWIGTLRGGLAKYRDGISYIYGYDDGLQNLTVNTLGVDHLGNIRIGTLNGLFTLSVGSKEIRHTKATDFFPITSITQDSTHRLWLTSMSDGLVRLSSGNLSCLNTTQGFPDDYIHCGFWDNQGNLWLGTDANGLIQLKRRTINNITQKNGLPENAVGPVLQACNGTIWVGTRNKGIVRLENSVITKVINKNSGLSGNRISCLFENDNGELWIGTKHSGVNILHGNKIKTLSKKTGLVSDKITTITKGNAGDIWIGTETGLNKYVNDRVLPHVENQLDNQHIRSIPQYDSDHMLIGTKSGLYDLDKKRNVQSLSNGFDALVLFKDHNNGIWIGTNGAGIKKFADGKLQSCTAEDGLPDNYIFSVTQDADNNFWFSSYKGVFKLEQSELADFFDNKISQVHPLLIDEADGMTSRHCTAEVHPSICKTFDGSLLFPTVNGISIIEPQSFQQTQHSPRILVEEIRVHNKPIPINDGAAFAAGTKNLEFKFTAFDYNAPNKIRFQYKLEGLDLEFKTIYENQERQVKYTNLPSGNYRFMVSAIDRFGAKSKQQAEYRFSILLPFYRQPIFILGTFLSFCLMIGLTYFIRYRKKIARQLNKYKSSALDPERAKRITPKLEILIKEEKIFLDPDLTLKKLAEKLNIHYNHLSQIINEQFGQSYNDYINKYRIEETKRRLSTQEDKDKTVLEIMYETGFYSKSVFNTAFKKFTGTTPSQFRKENTESS